MKETISASVEKEIKEKIKQLCVEEFERTGYRVYPSNIIETALIEYLKK